MAAVVLSPQLETMTKSNKFKPISITAAKVRDYYNENAELADRIRRGDVPLAVEIQRRLS
jgi:hypothetical protein